MKILLNKYVVLVLALVNCVLVIILVLPVERDISYKMEFVLLLALMDNTETLILMNVKAVILLVKLVSDKDKLIVILVLKDTN
jgi:hypothetical protein